MIFPKHRKLGRVRVLEIHCGANHNIARCEETHEGRARVFAWGYAKPKCLIWDKNKAEEKTEKDGFFGDCCFRPVEILEMAPEDGPRSCAFKKIGAGWDSSWCTSLWTKERSRSSTDYHLNVLQWQDEKIKLMAHLGILSIGKCKCSEYNTSNNF